MLILIVMMLHQLDILNIIKKIIKYCFENSAYYNTINYFYKKYLQFYSKLLIIKKN